MRKQISDKTLFAKYTALNIFGMLGLSCYILADTYFVSAGLGSRGLAALNLAISVYGFINGTGLMIGIGAATHYSILRASRDIRAKNVFTQAAAMGLAAGILFACAGLFFSSPISRFLGADAETLNLTDTYLKTLMSFSPLFILNNILIAFIRNDKNPNLAMAGMITGSLSNIILDYVFIFPCGMGMFGAALATGLAPLISILVLSIHFIKKKNSFHLQKCKIKIKSLLRFISVGSTAFITEASSGIVIFLFNLALLQISGNTAVAAYGIIANISLVCISIFTGISQGIQPLVSKSFGRGNTEQTHKFLRYAAMLAVTLAAVMVLCIFLFTPTVVSFFNSEQNTALAQIAENGLQIYVLGFPAAGLNIVLAAYFAAIEKVRESFLISIARGILLILPLILLLPQLFGLGGVWLVFTCTETLVLILSVFFYKSRKTAGKNKA